MTHDIPHDLSIELATKAAKKAAEAYAERFAEYGYKATWVSDTRVELGFSVRGMQLSGSMDVKARKIELELDVPFVFRPFKGKAIKIIEDEAKLWLERAKNGELD